MDINTDLTSGIKHEREPLSEKESVVCMNEELVVLLADLRPPRLPRLRRIARRDCEYIRCGTATVLCGAHPKAGQPDDLKWRTTPEVRTAFGILAGLAGFIAVFPRARAQMIVPVDRRLHPPQGFHFSGQWKCGAGASIAYIEVGNQNRATGGATLRLSGPWTEIRESEDGFNANYFVGYDRDKSQFLMIDADDPTSVAYSTEGWSGKKLVFTSSNGKDQLALPHRIQYVVNDSHQFTVTWEMLEGTDWKAEPSFMCIKVEHDHRRSITLPGR
jgi:hypothetical protein